MAKTQNKSHSHRTINNGKSQKQSLETQAILNRKYRNGFKHEDIFKVASSKLG